MNLTQQGRNQSVAPRTPGTPRKKKAERESVFGNCPLFLAFFASLARVLLLGTRKENLSRRHEDTEMRISAVHPLCSPWLRESQTIVENMFVVWNFLAFFASLARVLLLRTRKENLSRRHEDTEMRISAVHPLCSPWLRESQTIVENMFVVWNFLAFFASLARVLLLRTRKENLSRRHEDTEMRISAVHPLCFPWLRESQTIVENMFVVWKRDMKSFERRLDCLVFFGVFS